jgi:hypothetical protein
MRKRVIGLSKWRWMNVLIMNIEKYKIIKKCGNCHPVLSRWSI